MSTSPGSGNYWKTQLQRLTFVKLLPPSPPLPPPSGPVLDLRGEQDRGLATRCEAGHDKQVRRVRRRGTGVPAGVGWGQGSSRGRGQLSLGRMWGGGLVGMQGCALVLSLLTLHVTASPHVCFSPSSPLKPHLLLKKKDRGRFWLL